MHAVGGERRGFCSPKEKGNLTQVWHEEWGRGRAMVVKIGNGSNLLTLGEGV